MDSSQLKTSILLQNQIPSIQNFMEATKQHIQVQDLAKILDKQAANLLEKVRHIKHDLKHTFKSIQSLLAKNPRQGTNYSNLSIKFRLARKLLSKYESMLNEYNDEAHLDEFVGDKRVKQIRQMGLGPQLFKSIQKFQTIVLDDMRRKKKVLFTPLLGNVDNSEEQQANRIQKMVQNRKELTSLFGEDQFNKIRTSIVQKLSLSDPTHNQKSKGRKERKSKKQPKTEIPQPKKNDQRRNLVVNEKTDT